MNEITGKLLVIDDDADFADTVRLILERRGHQVFVATTGDDGLACARREHPEVIIVDLLMAPVDGFEICEALRSREETRHAAILVVSAIGRKMHKTFASPEVGARLHADGFLDKPIEFDALAGTVGDMLRLARSRIPPSKGNR